MCNSFESKRSTNTATTAAVSPLFVDNLIEEADDNLSPLTSSGKHLLESPSTLTFSSRMDNLLHRSTSAPCMPAPLDTPPTMGTTLVRGRCGNCGVNFFRQEGGQRCVQRDLSPSYCSPDCCMTARVLGHPNFSVGELRRSKSYCVAPVGTNTGGYKGPLQIEAMRRQSSHMAMWDSNVERGTLSSNPISIPLMRMCR